MEKKRNEAIYLAGGLYTNYQQLERMDEARRLRTMGYEVFNPMESSFNDKSTKPTAEMIFEGDTDGVMKANKVVLDIDTAGLGTALELGECVAVNTVHKLAEEGFTLAEILAKLPKKEVYAFTTDIRFTAPKDDNVGIRKPIGISQMFTGGILYTGQCYYDKELMFVDLQVDKEVG